MTEKPQNRNHGPDAPLTLKLRHTIPSHDTDPTVFRMIDLKVLDAAIGRVPAQIAARRT